MISGAIFDADGTLLDSMKIWEDVGTRYLLSIGKLPEEELSSILYSMTLEESSFYLKRHYCLQQSNREIVEGVLHIISDFYRFDVKLKPGVEEFLRELKGRNIPMVIATTGDSELLDTALKRLNVRDCFRSILTCSDLNTSKNEPVIYQKAASALGTDIKSTFVFEDVLYAIMSASEAGFVTVGAEDVSNASYKTAIIEESDYYISDFKDLTGFWKFAFNEKIKER